MREPSAQEPQFGRQSLRCGRQINASLPIPMCNAAFIEVPAIKGSCWSRVLSVIEIYQHVRAQRLFAWTSPLKCRRKSRKGRRDSGSRLGKRLPRGSRKGIVLFFVSSLTAWEGRVTLSRESHDASRSYSICSATDIGLAPSGRMPAHFTSRPGSR